MERIKVTEAARRFSDLLNQVFYRGASFELERNNQVVAHLSPPTRPRGLTVMELERLLNELPPLGDEREDFAEDLQAVRRAAGTEDDPWQ